MLRPISCITKNSAAPAARINAKNTSIAAISPLRDFAFGLISFAGASAV
jgi:hypothetical protein